MQTEKQIPRIKARYTRNIQALTAEEVQTLHRQRVCVIGCGGLGGYVVEILTRIGVGYITVADGDVFEESNLNRQLFSSEEVLGQSKAKVAVKRMKAVNSETVVRGLEVRLDAENGEEIVKGHDVVIDALDNAPTRLILADLCKALNLPLVHGGISGWYGQVCTILPGDDTMQNLYGCAPKKREALLGNLPFSASLVASLQCAECIKLLTGRGRLIRNELLQIDLLRGEFHPIKLR